ncbi:MAG: glycine cleavage system aminomethyltransferase GcvT [Candidatus Nanopelagicaceae bacterium]|jgi:aminomethyltransferase|nr:glycine cleavage system aminomethyltransferase GcvT [Actinomycetota bacterium]
MISAPLKRSPIHDFHKSAGAKLADFGGWEMPIEYPQERGGGVLNEHAAVRERVGLFDVSHLGKAEVKGAGALAFLNGCVTNDLMKISDGQAQYNLLCDDATGGVIDDLIVYRRSSADLFLIPNAANTTEVVARLKRAITGSIVINNLHEEYGVFALQGPLAKDVLKALKIEINLDYMSFTGAEIAGKEIIICRTGYTGELGFEILPKWEDARLVWDELVSAVLNSGGLVAGLGARDTLRTEMGYPLHGHELSLAISPVQASASWAVAWRKENFWGKKILVKERESGTAQILRGLILLDRGIPRAGMELFKGEIRVGITTSGTFSPTLKQGIALALISKEIQPDEEISVDIRGKKVGAKVVKPPFLPARVR